MLAEAMYGEEYRLPDAMAVVEASVRAARSCTAAPCLIIAATMHDRWQRIPVQRVWAGVAAEGAVLPGG
jgi:hypothetical protein